MASVDVRRRIRSENTKFDEMDQSSNNQRSCADEECINEERVATEDQDKKEKEKEEKDGSSLVSKRVTIAGGFLDFALFTANVEHLKFVLESGPDDVDYYTFLIWLLLISLGLQLLAGVLLFVIGFSDSKNLTRSQATWHGILNYVTMGIVSLIAIINVVITSFGDRAETVIQIRSRQHCRNNTFNDPRFRS